MKIILSRKGFDSSNGGIVSPIFEDGSMISFPIPSKDNGKTETTTGLAEADTEIIDRVYFENLIIDKVYECTGTLYEKETGEPVKDAEGKIITNTVSFKPTSTYGFIEVPFKYDASLLKGKQLFHSKM